MDGFSGDFPAGFPFRDLPFRDFQSEHAPQGEAARPKRQRPPGRKSLAQLFAESPFKGLDLDFKRDRDLGRDIEL